LGWQNNNQVLIDISASSSPYPILVFNPFTGSSKELTPNFPNIYTTSQNFMAWWHSYAAAMTIYDSALQLVLYPQSPTDLVLWDMNHKRELVKIHTQNPYGSRPQWSPDNQIIAVDVSTGSEYFSDEIVVINRKGEVKILTNFRNTIGPVDVQEYNWSPDGRYLAFWYNTNPEEKNSVYELATLAIDTGKTTNYCVFDYIRSDEISLLAPIWSPDGNEIIVRGNTTKEIGIVNMDEIFLLDLARKYLVKIEENVVPLGWMIDAP
jgi:Tol biopolymer transport system component